MNDLYHTRHSFSVYLNAVPLNSTSAVVVLNKELTFLVQNVLLG